MARGSSWEGASARHWHLGRMEKIREGAELTVGGESPHGNHCGAKRRAASFQTSEQGGHAACRCRRGPVDGNPGQGANFRGGVEREQHSWAEFEDPIGVFAAPLACPWRLEKPEARPRDDAGI